MEKSSYLPKGAYGSMNYATQEEIRFKNIMYGTNGYTLKTRFWYDFSMAECAGTKDIKDTYNKAKVWFDNIEIFAELVMVLKYKYTEWSNEDGKNSAYAKLYNELYNKADDMANKKYKFEDLREYLKILEQNVPIG